MKKGNFVQSGDSVIFEEDANGRYLVTDTQSESASKEKEQMKQVMNHFFTVGYFTYLPDQGLSVS